MTMNPKQITSIMQLKTESAGGKDFFILLNGYMRSSKWIEWDENESMFTIYNEIDNTSQYLTEEQLLDKEHTLIGEAMTKGALYKYRYTEDDEYEKG